MTERRAIGSRVPLFCRALAIAALLVSALAPRASLSAEALRTTAAADPPTSTVTLVPAGSAPAAGCDAQSMLSDPAPVGATEDACVAPDLERDQAYLIETARPGNTMLHQGPALAVMRLHPTFVRRLAGAISEARAAGLPFAGIFSAYRPPAFGVGGFADKFNSLHTYGLAVDLLGIGRPGSTEAKLWYEIAGRHGIVCPYGADNRREWNHCQPTSVKSVMAGDPLRGTVSPPGPIDLEAMFAMGDALVAATDAGAGTPELQPAIDEKSSSRNPGQPRLQGAAADRGESIKIGHEPSQEMHRRVKLVAGSVPDHSLEAHGQSKRRIIAENASIKSGPVKKLRIASLVRRESFVSEQKPGSSKEHAPAKRITESAHLDRAIKGVCRGC